MKNITRVYDGAMFCGTSDCGCGCPVIDFIPEEKLVVVSDPAKPENGKFTMTLDEYNALIKNAKEIKSE